MAYYLTTIFQNTIQCSFMSYQNFKQRQKKLFFVYFFRGNTYFTLIETSNKGEMKILHYTIWHLET